MDEPTPAIGRGRFVAQAPKPHSNHVPESGMSICRRQVRIGALVPALALTLGTGPAIAGLPLVSSLKSTETCRHFIANRRDGCARLSRPALLGMSLKPADDRAAAVLADDIGVGPHGLKLRAKAVPTNPSLDSAPVDQLMRESLRPEHGMGGEVFRSPHEDRST